MTQKIELYSPISLWAEAANMLITCLLLIVVPLGIFCFTIDYSSPLYNVKPFLLLIGACFLIPIAMLIYRAYSIKGYYVPGVSFSFFRKDPVKLRRTALIIMGGAILFGVALLLNAFTDGGVLFGLLSSEDDFLSQIAELFYLAPYITFMYGWALRKSAIVHGDVDYAANEQLAEAMGMEIDEVVTASYQAENELMVMTNRRIYYAQKAYGSKQWMVINEPLCNIVKFGLINHPYNQMSNANDVKQHLAMYFIDHKEIVLGFTLYDKLTSTPNLIGKKVLETLDSYLTGTLEEKVSRRRRTITTGEQPAQSTPTTETMVRKIEIDSETMDELKKAAETSTPRRNLEL